MFSNFKEMLDDIFYLFTRANNHGPFIGDDNCVVDEVLTSLIHLLCDASSSESKSWPKPGVTQVVDRTASRSQLPVQPNFHPPSPLMSPISSITKGTAVLHVSWMIGLEVEEGTRGRAAGTSF
jgi:hypothetical protein